LNPSLRSGQARDPLNQNGKCQLKEDMTRD